MDVPQDQPSVSRNTIKNEKHRNYSLTWNNYTEEDKNELVKYANEKCSSYVINPEKGKEGTPHLQIALCFKNPRSFNSIKKDFPKCHIEIARNKNALLNYCQKEDTKVGDTIKNIEKFDIPKTIELIDPLDGLELKEWQQYIINLIKLRPDRRTIHWLYDTIGGTGKTSLAFHLCMKYPKEVLYIAGKANDIKYGVQQFIYKKVQVSKGRYETLPINQPLMMIFDFVRTSEDFISYDAIESVKNGIFFSGKYEAGMVQYNPCHVICFANFYPKIDKLSADRWNIRNITENKDTNEDINNIQKIIDSIEPN